MITARSLAQLTQEKRALAEYMRRLDETLRVSIIKIDITQTPEQILDDLDAAIDRAKRSVLAARVAAITMSIGATERLVKAQLPDTAQSDTAR